VTIVEAMAEKAARGELTSPEVQASLAILLRDLVAREGPSGVVSRVQDDVPTRKNTTPPRR
jgi:hypothetical protein